MSTTSPSDHHDFETLSLSTFIHTPASFGYAITHVFFPVQLPDHDDYTLENDSSLAHAVCAAAHAYSAHVNGTTEPQWPRITRMLDNLQASVQSESLDRDHVITQLREMQTGDILAFFIRPHNTAIVLTKQEKSIQFESFKVSPSSDAVEEMAGSLICSYPRSTVETPNEVSEDAGFQSELDNFIAHPDGVNLDFPLPFPDLGCTVDIPRITKHVRDGVVRRWKGYRSSEPVWRRSALWLLIRVAIQMSLDRSPLGRASYKRFMLFFVCTLARDRNNTKLSSDVLHLISCKILRRLRKFRSSTPDWLSERALKTCACLEEILDDRLQQSSVRSFPFQNPSEDELRRDTQLSLLDSREYICNVLTNHSRESPSTLFHPCHHRRGTIDDFLSSNGAFFEEAYRVDPLVTLYDVAQTIEQGLDDWFASVRNVEEACIQLEILMDQYTARANLQLDQSPENGSVMFLTVIELFVALDKLVVKEIPMLADYSPEIPISCLERLLLRKTTSLHRLSRAWQYLSVRHSYSRLGWSVLSDEFTEDSFAVRYYDQSPHLQQLKARIEEDVAAAGRSGLDQGPAGFTRLLPLHTKVVVFELQCPACVHIWRSAAARILEYSVHHDSDYPNTRLEVNDLLAHAPAFQPYFVECQLPPLLYQFRFAVKFRKNPTLRYVVRSMQGPALWKPSKQGMPSFTYEYQAHNLSSYVDSTSHTANDILAAQADCPADFSLDEFIAFGHLRSGGSLQWLNILRGLRSRTLNLRRREVHYLLSQAAFEVGPLDPDTGTWTWHKELQDLSFCNTLLDELDGLFVDVGANSINSVMMNTISLLLTRVLESSPSEHISERALALLRSVRKKTFGWVQELSYNLAVAPMNEERRQFLHDMAATCRSTFDVGLATLRKLFYSAEDVDALLSCAFFINTLCPEDIDNNYSGDGRLDNKYSQLLFQRDRHLAVALERIVGGLILADVSDYAVDLAVSKIFPSNEPSANRWLQLQHPDARWFACKIGDQHSQTVYLNLLNGELQLDGRPLGGLPRAIRDSSEHQEIFRNQGFFVIPSNLPGMDFTTFVTTCKHKVHFSLRGANLVVRAQCTQTNDILEVIPQRMLQTNLPTSLLEGHVHWLNLSTRFLEIRPLEQLWEESSENWRIDCTSRQYHMYKGRETLVDIWSPTWDMVSKYFQGFNVGNVFKNLLITVSPIHSSHQAPVLRLSVALPHHSLSFFVNEEGELESRDFKDMVYDENQCVGTLFGLESLLVLRPKTHLPEELIPRRVLIPDGFPTRHDDHWVRINNWARKPTGPSHEPLYHTYSVDTELGCLVGNGSLTSTQHLAYLHATTSSHRPDPLTGKTGAQAAFCLLQSAGDRSVMRLKAFEDRGPWTSTPYPQINIAFKEIQLRYHWKDRDSRARNEISLDDKCAARRAAYLFPWHATGSTPPEDCNYDDNGRFTTHVPVEPGLSTLPHPISPPRYISDKHTSWRVTLHRLLANRPAPKLPARRNLPCYPHKTSPDDISQVNQLLSLLMSKSDHSFQREYVTSLRVSAQRAREGSRMTRGVAGGNRIEALEKHYAQCRANYLNALDILKKCLGPTTDSHEQALNRFGQWPPITADVLLRYLAPTSQIDVPLCWKKCLVSLALLLLDVQRARRLLQFALDGREEEFSKELENEGCDGWNPEDYPEWLLIQIQGNFLIRRTQAETAMEMMSPKSGGNTVMQINMGEGKSSVIIPIVAATLANGKQLARVVVPKALTVQMFELLVTRLGGLTNRPIYHLPFSRSLYYADGSPRIDRLHKIMSQCMAERGILLVQPEHVTSLKLISVEEQIREERLVADPLRKPQKSIYKYITTTLSLKSLRKHSIVGNIFRSLSQSLSHSSETHAALAEYYDERGGDAHGDSDNASESLRLQKWIYFHARDILDESDEVLHPRFQLIYTIGLQQHMDGYPDRWTITQQVLWLVKSHADSLSGYVPDSIEYERGPPGSFPYFNIVRASDVGRNLVWSVVEDVMAGRLPTFRFQSISPALYEAIRSFISDENVLADTAKRVEVYAKGSQQSHLWNGLLLLRGLLACNVLLFALVERRWRVDYGLDPRSRFFDSTSTMLAIPYRAKDVPALNTRFGHPDITIILTCLAYYYAGLTEEQLRASFEILLDEDDPSMEYALWVKEYEYESIPDTLRELGEINLNSSEQWDNVIFLLFTRNQAAIDFYLSRVVFPTEAKEFPRKLSASSWDLAERHENIKTGFSGTNDSRLLLPMSIAQRDLDHQQGINARVLAYLLRPENDSYMVTHENGERWSTLRFLQMIALQQPNIRVLLDVGAQILDFSSEQVATAWLDIAHDTAGAIYFNDYDELMVLTKSGTTQPIRSSPLSEQLDRCVVYLDHAHTRGTDMKLPVGSRAAVTLGPKVTKDQLVQGCMRMRKLGHGHSVMFFAPLEVDQSVRSVAGKNDPNTQLATTDILCWAISETWTDIQQRAPYWAQQGMSYRLRSEAWTRFCNDELGPDELSDAWFQPELKTLTDLYAPSETRSASNTLSELDADIRQRCKNLGVLSLPSAQMEEEQEREVNREREREREVELPPEAEPAQHYLHPDVVKFVNTGEMPPLHANSVFQPIFTTLKQSSAATREADVWSPFILATADFCKTINPESTRGTLDQYLRPVQWILSRKNLRDHDQLLVLLSPFEAYSLMPDIRASEYVHLHVYAPRTSHRMKPSDALTLYSIPPLPPDWTPPWALIDQLNVFAGQFYLRNYQSYLRLCRFLDMPTEDSPNEPAARRNLFNIPGSFEENEIRFSDSPLPSVWALLAIRNRGQPFTQTHMGKILQGQLLTEKDFERPRLAMSGHHPPARVQQHLHAD